jgi:hypothetical protein
MDTYKKFIAVTNRCHNRGCDTKQVKAFFESYIRQSEDITDGELYRMLDDWMKLFQSINKKIAAVKTAAKNVQTHLKTTSSKFSSTTKSMCKKNKTCDKKGVKSFITQGKPSQLIPASVTYAFQCPTLSRRSRR